MSSCFVLLKNLQKKKKFKLDLSFDPNAFVTGIDYKSYGELRDSLDLPLFNRALKGQYPPGSTCNMVKKQFKFNPTQNSIILNNNYQSKITHLLTNN
mgnify:CR=1 FL=1